VSILPPLKKNKLVSIRLTVLSHQGSTRCWFERRTESRAVFYEYREGSVIKGVSSNYREGSVIKLSPLFAPSSWLWSDPVGARRRRTKALRRRAPLGSGWMRVTRGGSGAKAPPLAARPKAPTLNACPFRPLLVSEEPPPSKPIVSLWSFGPANTDMATRNFLWVCDVDLAYAEETQANSPRTTACVLCFQWWDSFI